MSRKPPPRDPAADGGRLGPGRLVLPPEVREITSYGPHDRRPTLIRYEDHQHLDLIGGGVGDEPRAKPPGSLPDVPVIYLCGHDSESHRWGVDLDENDFFRQVGALKDLAERRAIHHAVVGVRRTNFHRLDRIVELISRCRGDGGCILDPFPLRRSTRLCTSFEDYLSRANTRISGHGVELRVVDEGLWPLLEVVERQWNSPHTKRAELLRALGPVCKDVFTGPRFLLFDLAGDCNVDCIYCRLFSPLACEGGERREERDVRFLHFESVRAVLEEAHDLGVEEVLLVGGGEPTLHRQFSEIVGLVHERGMCFNFSTNGSLLDRHTDAVLGGGCRSVTVSLSFASGEGFARVRPGSAPRLRRRIEDNVRALAAQRSARGLAGPEIIALYAICKQNFDEVPAMVAHASGLGADTIWFQLVHVEPFSREQIGLTDEQMARLQPLIEDAKASAERFGLRFHSFINFELEHLDEEAGDWSKGGLLHQGCYVGWHFSFVQLGREVSLCCGTRTVGILDDDGRGFNELWNSDTYRRYRNDGLIMHRENPLTLFGRPLYDRYCDSCDNHDQNQMMRSVLEHTELADFVER